MPKKTGKYLVRIEKDRCKGCGLCVEFCRRQVLAMTGEKLNAHGVPYAECVNPEQCVCCQACVLICPDAAVELFQIDE